MNLYKRLISVCDMVDRLWTWAKLCILFQFTVGAIAYAIFRDSGEEVWVRTIFVAQITTLIVAVVGWSLTPRRAAAQIWFTVVVAEGSFFLAYLRVPEPLALLPLAVAMLPLVLAGHEAVRRGVQKAPWFHI